MIYLRHPKHGVKIATMEMEAQYDEQHGWARFDPADIVDDPDIPVIDEPSLAVDEPEPLPEPSVEDNVLAPRRRGRPRVTKDE
jgi:hypothetical protein